MKQLPINFPDQCIRVAPHAGAWIETLDAPLVNIPWTVAPHAGAWIETLP